jgi:hypothetical protein
MCWLTKWFSLKISHCFYHLEFFVFILEKELGPLDRPIFVLCDFFAHIKRDIHERKVLKMLLKQYKYHHNCHLADSDHNNT